MGECDAGINQTIRKNLKSVKSCHETSLKSNPDVAGRIVIDVEIMDGKVLSANIASNKTGNSVLGACIERRVKRWIFPTTCSDTATFPFVLSIKK